MKKKLIIIFLLTVVFTFCEAAVYYFDDFKINCKSKKLSQKLGNWLNNDIEKVQKKLGYYPNLNFTLNVANNKKQFDDWVKKYAPNLEFSEAFACLNTKQLYIKNPGNLKNFDKLRSVILHEYIHLLIASRFVNAPLWFHEGLAVFYSEGLSINREYQYIKADLLNKTTPLHKMVNYPKNKGLVDAFYGKSVYAVKLLKKTYTKGFYKMWNCREKNFYSAFFIAYGINVKGFDEQIKSYTFQRRIVFIALSASSILWGLLPVFILITYFKRKKLSKMLDAQINESFEENNINENDDTNRYKLLKND